MAEPTHGELETLFSCKAGSDLIVEHALGSLTPYPFTCLAPFQRSLIFISVFRRVFGTNSSSAAHKMLYFRSWMLFAFCLTHYLINGFWIQFSHWWRLKLSYWQDGDLFNSLDHLAKKCLLLLWRHRVALHSSLDGFVEAVVAVWLKVTVSEL